MAQAEERPGAGGRVRRWLAVLGAGLAAFRGENLKLRAMALTYISIFSLLPALMVTVSMVRLFPDLDRVRSRIHDFLVSNLAVGARDRVESYLDLHVFDTSATTPGLLGFALLFASAVTLLGQVEHAVNAIWAVHRKRPMLQRWLMYWAALTVGPLVIAGSVAIALAAHEQIGAPGFAGQVAITGLTVIFFVLAYLVVPATRVRFLPALVGGVVAALAFELAKWGYAWAAAHLFRFQAVYGSLAAAFVFLLWLYLVWTIFLFGARLAFVVQHHRSLLDQDRVDAMGRELLAVRALLDVALAWWDGKPGPDAGEVADRLDAPAETVREIVASLEEGGFLAEADDGRLTPARPLARVSLADVRRVITGPPPRPPQDALAGRLAERLDGGEGAAVQYLSKTTLQDLCQAERPASPGPTPAPAAAPPPHIPA